MKLPRPYSAGIDPAVIDHIRSAQNWSQYFPSIRDGNTGVGMTFENLCGLPENNWRCPDLYGAELKAKRLDSDSLLTLMTKNPPRAVRKMTMEFGTDHFDEAGDLERRRFYYTVRNKTSALFRLEQTDESLNLITDDRVVAQWTAATLARALNKLTNLCLIDAKTKLVKIKDIDAKTKTKLVKSKEYFQYTGFVYYHGFDQQKFIDMLIDGEAFIDFRAHYSYEKNKMRDHGTAFRIQPEKLTELYDGSIRVELI